MSADKIINQEQMQLIRAIKDKIRTAQYKAVVQANSQLIELYWQVGHILNEHAAYGNSFVQRLAAEIAHEFPGLKGFSQRNLHYMKKFAAEITDFEILQTVSAKFNAQRAADRDWSAALCLFRYYFSSRRSSCMSSPSLSVNLSMDFWKLVKR